MICNILLKKGTDFITTNEPELGLKLAH